MSNRDTCTDEINKVRNQVHLAEPHGGRAGHPVHRHPVIRFRSEDSCENELIDCLDVQHRMILKLRYIAIIDLSSSELEEAQRISGKSYAQISSEVKELTHRQRNSTKMKDYHRAVLQLYSRHFFILENEKQLTAARKQLVDLYYSEQKLMSIESKAQAITFKQIKTDRKHLSALQNRSDDKETMRNVDVQLMELEYLEAFKRYLYDYERYENLVDSFVSGKQYRALGISAQEIAKLLNTTKQAVFNRVERARKRLELENERKDSKKSY